VAGGQAAQGTETHTYIHGDIHHPSLRIQTHTDKRTPTHRHSSTTDRLQTDMRRHAQRGHGRATQAGGWAKQVGRWGQGRGGTNLFSLLPYPSTCQWAYRDRLLVLLAATVSSPPVVYICVPSRNLAVRQPRDSDRPVLAPPRDTLSDSKPRLKAPLPHGLCHSREWYMLLAQLAQSCDLRGVLPRPTTIFLLPDSRP